MDMASKDVADSLDATGAMPGMSPGAVRSLALTESGGKPGATSSFWLNAGSNRAVNLRNTDIVKIGPGDVISVACGGAAGWGDPLARDPEKVALDVARGFVSVSKARDDYGVVLKGRDADPAATEKLRAGMKARRTVSKELFDYGDARHAHEAVWTDGNYGALTELLAGVPVHWRFYLKHRVFDAIAALDPSERKGDGQEVRRVFAKLIDEFPQLRQAAAE